MIFSIIDETHDRARFIPLVALPFGIAQVVNALPLNRQRPSGAPSPDYRGRALERAAGHSVIFHASASFPRRFILRIARRRAPVALRSNVRRLRRLIQAANVIFCQTWQILLIARMHPSAATERRCPEGKIWR